MKITISHTDKSSNTGSAISGYYYVRPLTPPAPTVTQIAGNDSALLLSVNADSNEHPLVNYAVYCQTTGQWVNAVGGLQASKIQMQITGWQDMEVYGLNEGQSYTFRVVAHNPYRSSWTFSDMSPGGTASPRP